MFFNNYFYLLMLMLSMFMFIYFYSQILLTMISLEFMMINLLMLVNNMMMTNNNMIIILYYLVFMVCESVLGLTMLIILIRSYGNNNMKLMNLNLW